MNGAYRNIEWKRQLGTFIKYSCGINAVLDINVINY
jgi:hypothetical protein